LEQLFRKHHGDNELRCERSSIINLTNVALVALDIPKDVVEFYIRCRTYFRIRRLNKQNTPNARKERKKNAKQNR